MTPEEIRVRLYAAHANISLQKARKLLRSEKYFLAGDCANRLFTEYLEITKLQREKTEELAGALEDILRVYPGDLQCQKIASEVLARYRIVKEIGL